jgi:rhodanese-related sulfurtransferase
MTATTAQSTVKEVDAGTLDSWLREGRAVVVDVRPADLFAAERIRGARSLPLAAVDRSTLPELDGRKLVFQCEVGMASEKAARKLSTQGWEGDVYNLAGGLRAWKRAGLPVERDPNAGVSLPRQVQMVAGSLVLLGLALGVTVSPWFLVVSAFIGAGLIFAGVTGACGMAALLARLPHNRRRLDV